MAGKKTTDGERAGKLESAGARAADRLADELAQRFEEALRLGQPRASKAIAEEALTHGLDAAAIYAHLIEPAMKSIGSMWERGAVSIGEEHLATAISEDVAATVYAKALRTEPGSRARVMLAAVQGEWHVLGLRLCADVLEGAGYEVFYLGADVPLVALLDAARIHRPDVVGLTASMWLNVPTMIWEIDEITKTPDPPRIMVGGRAVGHALALGVAAPLINHCDELLPALERLLAEPQVRAVVPAELLARTPRGAPAPAAGAEAHHSIAAAFADTASAAADTARESARRAFGLERLAYRDELTGLFNRRAFDDRLLEMSDQGEQDSSVLMIDVDRFKSINDAHGHDAGDEALVNVAGAIQSSLRPGDFAARFGGDEFAVLLADAPARDAAAIAERIRVAVASAPAEDPLTVSVGLAPITPDTRLSRQSADRALYAAKSSGRNAVATAEG